jgi:hypothetical protein
VSLYSSRVCSTESYRLPYQFTTRQRPLIKYFLSSQSVLTPASLLALTTSVSVSVNLVLATVIYLTTGGVVNAALGGVQTRVRYKSLRTRLLTFKLTSSTYRFACPSSTMSLQPVPIPRIRFLLVRPTLAWRGLADCNILLL